MRGEILIQICRISYGQMGVCPVVCSSFTQQNFSLKVMSPRCTYVLSLGVATVLCRCRAGYFFVVHLCSC